MDTLHLINKGTVKQDLCIEWHAKIKSEPDYANKNN